jgi:hypothetical protein
MGGTGTLIVPSLRCPAVTSYFFLLMELLKPRALSKVCLETARTLAIETALDQVSWRAKSAIRLRLRQQVTSKGHYRSGIEGV